MQGAEGVLFVASNHRNLLAINLRYFGESVGVIGFTHGMISPGMNNFRSESV